MVLVLNSDPHKIALRSSAMASLEDVLASPMLVVDQLPIALQAIEKERRRVAKELHDEILPLIARLSRFVQSSKEGSLARLLQVLHGTIADLRDLLGELHPVDLEEIGLVSALHTICTRYARKSGLCILFVPLGGEEGLEFRDALCLHRAVQDILRRFCRSQNDILVISCDLSDQPLINIRCIDKRVASADWLNVHSRNEDRNDGITYHQWCSAIGADVKRDVSEDSTQAPYDLTIRLSKSIGHSIPCAVRDSLDGASSGWVDADDAVLDERSRISDQIAANVLLNFKVLRKELCAIQDPTICTAIANQLGEIERGLHQLMMGAYPDYLIDLPLSDCFRILLDEFEKGTGIVSSFESRGLENPIELGFESKLALYRITQESLNNIEKHSGASHAKVLLGYRDNQLFLVVEDNGVGMGQSFNSNCRGLRNVRDRAVEINAKVSVTSTNSYSTGTSIALSIPYMMS